MKLETFFEKFDQFADAPNAVAKMRELVLELAVQGKLVEQKPAEGDGRALLKQIHKKNPPSLTEAEGEPMDSELASFPSSWASSKLGEVAEIIRGVTFPGSAKSETRSNGDVACLRTASVQAEIDWDDLIYISPTHVSREDQWVIPNDIMISMANSYALVGKVAIVREVPQKATFGAFLAAIRPVLIEPYFLLYVLRSPRMQAAFRASSSQTTNIANISLGRMRPLPFPLPPLAEQHRIVAKVDELMALCDRLEAARAEREATRDRLAASSLARLNAPDPETFQADARFVLNALPALTTRPDQIKQLRQTILNLAVRGKLVPQDPKDEPAAELLKRIAAEKARLVKAGEIKKEKSLPESEPGEAPFVVSRGWEWVCVRKVTSDRGQMVPDQDFTYIDVTAINKEVGRIEDAKVTSAAEAPSRARKIVRKGDVLYSCVRPYLLNIAIVDLEILPPPIASTAFAVLNGFGLVVPRYLWIVLRSPFFVVCVEEKMRGQAYPAINDSDFSLLPFPLPPFAEQHRIVAKVDELMALCDQLEANLTDTDSTRRRLLDALLAEALEPAEVRETEAVG